MFKKLKQDVLTANIQLQTLGLVILTWGNVSQRSNDGKFIAIKPSGVEYNKLNLEDIVVLDLEGNVVEGRLKPSSDTSTHLEIYNAFKDIGSICHTHSTYATAFAQAGKTIDCFGTTHADYFYGSVQCTRDLSIEEVKTDYEKNTGKVIVETIKNNSINNIKAILARHHGVFTWGKNAVDAVEKAYVLEEIAKMNFLTLQIEPTTSKVPNYILDKHFSRKNGKKSYYGQTTNI